jgi:hypothetical protein
MKKKEILLLCLFVFGVVSIMIPTQSYAISLDDDEEDREDVGDYLQSAKSAAKNENFSQAQSLLKKAKSHGVLLDDVKEVQNYIAQKKQAYENRLERERQAKLERERQERERIARLERERTQNNSRVSQQQRSFCFQLKSQNAIQACLGEAYSTNENAKNIILGNCYSLKGYNKTALTQVCTQGKQGCYTFNNSDVVHGCVSCGGSNRWLRIYAAGALITCY